MNIGLHQGVGEDRLTHDIHRKDESNIGVGERALSAALGTCLLGYGLRRRGVLGWGAAAMGGSLLVHGARSHCGAYDHLGVTSEDATAASNPFNRVIHCRAYVTITRPAHELYQQWRDTASLAPLFPHVQSIEKLDERRSRWTASPAGQEIAWTATITQDQADRLIAWESDDDTAFEHSGMIEFRPAPADRGTRVTLELAYEPAGGLSAVLLTKMLGSDAESEAAEALRRFRQWMEAGEIASARSPAARDEGWNPATMRGEEHLTQPRRSTQPTLASATI